MIILFEIGTEFVDPTETAGFAGALKKAFGSNGAPVTRTVSLHVVDEHFVFFGFPWPFLYLFLPPRFHFLHL